MIFGSVCSGIEAASVAWEPMGWNAAFLSEIEPFPRAILEHHYPDVPLRGDFREIQGADHEAIDLLVGGTPCQSFSLAGLRGGLGDDRGNLALEYLRLVDRLRPRWWVWENVPGVLSSGRGRDFGAFLGALGELGYGWAYRVLDAQFVRVDGYPRAIPQRRRRVFVVGCAGDWRRAAAVLFERPRSEGHPPPRRSAKRSDAGVPGGSTPPGLRAGADVASTITATGHASEGPHGDFWYGGGLAVSHDPAVPLRSEERGSLRPESNWSTVVVSSDPAATLKGRDHKGPAVESDGGTVVASLDAVRRLTPRECERLQGFPDDYTRIAWRGKPPDDCPDGRRYKCLGNSMAVNVMRWIGRRIELVERLCPGE
jgi:DNA (cytosine-5)-methyltransferase 1